MRSVLIGAVESSAIALQALRAAGHPPDSVITLDREIGKKRHSDYVDLEPLAGPDTTVLRCRNANKPEIISHVRGANPDFLFVIGWSQIVGAELQSCARNFTIGFHPTALPLYRGRAPLAWTILLGLTETAGSLFIIDDGVDSGPILAQKQVLVSPRETVASLMDKHMDALRAMLDDLIPALACGDWQEQQQNHSKASYCAARRPEDGLVDWSAPAESIDRLVRATTRPYPGAFTFTRTSRVTIWSCEPVRLSNSYYGQVGQIVCFEDDCPVVLCGVGEYVRLTDYEVEGDKMLTGQPRFLPYRSHDAGPA